MCGIVGLIGFKGSESLLEKMATLQGHRGPDNEAKWVKDDVAFAHQRLSIIDVSERANQPMSKNGLVIIFNGEIYNYKELRDDLLGQHVTFDTNSDTEVVLELFRKLGAESLNLLNGMFSFCIYDEKSGESFLARDHFGIKPLFYTLIDNNFAFASELKALCALPNFNKTINKGSLVKVMNYLWLPGNETMFDGCFKLPPATYMTISKDKKSRLYEYWQLNETSSIGSLSESVEAVDREFTASVRRHMVADVPVGAFLSGGLDSSLISVLAASHTKELATFTVATSAQDKRIEQMPADEKYAKKLAEEHGFSHNEIIINADIVENLPKIVRILDEPIGDPAALNTFLICEAARKKGIKVLLSGMGADEMFLGYRRQKATFYAQRYKLLPPFVQKLIYKFVQTIPVKIFGRGFRFSRWSKKFISFSNLPVHEAYRMSYSYYSIKEIKQLLKPNFHSFIKEMINDHQNIFESKFCNDLGNQMCNTDLNMFMNGLNLTYTDRASMAASVEVRVPFIDRNVVETAMSIPSKFKLKGGESKFVLKKMAEKYLSKTFIYRSKASFGAPIRSWISNDLMSLVDDLLSPVSLARRGIFEVDFVREMIENDRNGKEDNAYQIYQLLTIELWFREFVDK